MLFLKMQMKKRKIVVNVNLTICSLKRQMNSFAANYLACENKILTKPLTL